MGSIQQLRRHQLFATGLFRMTSSSSAHDTHWVELGNTQFHISEFLFGTALQTSSAISSVIAFSANTQRNFQIERAVKRTTCQANRKRFQRVNVGVTGSNKTKA